MGADCILHGPSARTTGAREVAVVKSWPLVDSGSTVNPYMYVRPYGLSWRQGTSEGEIHMWPS